MARSAACILLLCAIAGGVQAKTLPVIISRRAGHNHAPTPQATASAPQQARTAGVPVLGTVGNIIGGEVLPGPCPASTVSFIPRILCMLSLG